MGCCISKFSPKTKDSKKVEEPQEKYCYVPEKMFMSRCPNRVSPLVLLPDKTRFIPIPVPDKLPPPSQVKSTSSFSPIKPSTLSNSSLSSSSSSLSTASSISISKERSFSNDFLRACYQENSHVSRINSLRESSLSLKTTKLGYPNRSNSPVIPNRYSMTPNRANENPKRGTNGSKRSREPSPNHRVLTRQKSFRQHQEKVVMSCSNGKLLKSPSPSRRFGMDSAASCVRKEGLDLYSHKTCLQDKRSETRIHRISSKMDETVVKEVVTNHKEPVVPIIEEMSNPLIDLDCFIFL